MTDLLQNGLSILDRLARGDVLISDGATGTFLQCHGLEAGGCPEEFNDSHGDVVRQMAVDYFTAGSDMVETNSFGGSRYMLKKYDHDDRVEEFNRKGAEHARAAAPAGRTRRAAWEDYVRWAGWLWEGAIGKLIDAVQARSKELGPAVDGDETSPAAIAAQALGYLKNQSGRMKYHEYRQLGLPSTSSHIESTIKQINRRVKGTEKFWDQGVEPLLQLAADHLTETNRLDQFWKARRTQLQPMRCYQAAA